MGRSWSVERSVWWKCISCEQISASMYWRGNWNGGNGVCFWPRADASSALNNILLCITHLLLQNQQSFVGKTGEDFSTVLTRKETYFITGIICVYQLRQLCIFRPATCLNILVTCVRCYSPSPPSQGTWFSTDTIPGQGF